MQRLLESSGIQKSAIRQGGEQLKSLKFSRKIIKEKESDEKRVGGSGKEKRKRKKREQANF